MDQKTKLYSGFMPSGDSFEIRVGRADSFSASVGRVVICFSWLEEELSKGIVKLTQTSQEIGNIITTELSYKNKVHLFAALVRHLAKEYIFNTGSFITLEAIDALETNCFKAEELRNQVVHSSWHGPTYKTKNAIRRKQSLRAKKGFVLHLEKMDSGNILDIADFFSCVRSDIEEFFLIYKKKPKIPLSKID